MASEDAIYAQALHIDSAWLGIGSPKERAYGEVMKIKAIKASDLPGIINASQLRSQAASEPVEEKPPVPISADEIKELIKKAIQSFGRYSYIDKGPNEVMDMAAIESRLRVMEPASVADVLAEVRKIKDLGDIFVQSVLVGLQDVDKMSPIYEDERINDLY